MRFAEVKASILLAALLVAACGGDDDGGTKDPVTSPGAGGAIAASGGAPGVAGATGGALAVGSGGSAAPGTLTCGGRLCKGFGRCAADGACPAFLGSCFTSTQFQTCGEACESIGADCAATSCNYDGSMATTGYSWVSYPSTDGAKCAASGPPQFQNFDACSQPVWFDPRKPRDDIVRCCCREPR